VKIVLVLISLGRKRDEGRRGEKKKRLQPDVTRKTKGASL